MSRRIGIIAAQHEESSPLIKRLTEMRQGLYLQHDTEFLITHSGVGKLNAMHTAYHYLVDHKVDELINIGVAAGRGDLMVGDVVSVSQVYDGDFDISVFNHKKFYVPEVGDYIDIENDITLFRSVPCFTVSRFESGCIDTDIADYVIDMEYYAIALAGKRFNVPTRSIKIISDTLVKDNYKSYNMNLESCCEKLSYQVANYLQVR